MRLWILFAAFVGSVCPSTAWAQVPGNCEVRTAEAAGQPGCYLLSAIVVGMPGPRAYWHIDRFATLKAARDAATPASHAALVFGIAFLQTVNNNPHWRPRGGRRMAMVGPLPISHPDEAQIARLMESTTTANMTSSVHVHSGPEAWYLIEGTQCLETPDNVRRISKGQTSWVEAGPSMQLSKHGGSVRRALVLVLHPKSRPWMTMTHSWQPKGKCVPVR